MTKPGGRAIVGFPVHWNEELCFNAHRQYGKVQLQHLFANWRQVHTDVKDLSTAGAKVGQSWGFQPLFVLEKEEEV